MSIVKVYRGPNSLVVGNLSVLTNVGYIKLHREFEFEVDDVLVIEIDGVDAYQFTVQNALKTDTLEMDGEPSIRVTVTASAATPVAATPVVASVVKVRRIPVLSNHYTDVISVINTAAGHIELSREFEFKVHDQVVIDLDGTDEYSFMVKQAVKTNILTMLGEPCIMAAAKPNLGTVGVSRSHRVVANLTIVSTTGCIELKHEFEFEVGDNLLIDLDNSPDYFFTVTHAVKTNTLTAMGEPRDDLYTFKSRQDFAAIYGGIGISAEEAVLTSGKEFLLDDIRPKGEPITKPVCPDCKGSGQYVGLNHTEPCSLCNGAN